ncbi:MAG: MFS transporter [Nanoarchaeota archaeon]|nr:MFS transporter [Nanoarchaeota archaeon]
MQKNRRILTALLFLIALGSSMSSIFLPIYLYNLSTSFKGILLIYLVYFLGGLIAGVFSNLIAHKASLNSFIILRGIIEPVIILLFRYCPILKFPLFPVMLVYGFITFGFWLSLDTYTVLSTDKKKRGNQQGNIYMGMWLASIAAPFVAGLIISRFGYAQMFWVSFIFVFIGGALSFFVKTDLKIKKKINYFPKITGEIGKLNIITFLRGFGFGITTFLLPLFVFFISDNEVVVGTAGMIFGVTNVFATILSGHLIDAYNKKKVLSVLHALMVIAWIILGLSTDANSIYYILVILVFIYQLINIPLNTVFFNQIEKKDVLSYISERMTSFILGSVAVYLLGLFFGFEVLFIICGVAAFLALFVINKLEL